MKFWLYLGIYILVMGFLNIEGPNRTRERGFIGHIKKAICNTQNLLSKLFSKGSNGEYDEDDGKLVVVILVGTRENFYEDLKRLVKTIK